MRNGDYDLIRAPAYYPGTLYRGRYCYLHVFVYWFYHRVLPGPTEQVHHRNENKRDDRIQNLEMLSHVDHRKAHRTGPGEVLQTTCPVCQKVFTRSRRQLYDKKLVFCSRACIGKYGFAAKFRAGVQLPEQKFVVVSSQEPVAVAQVFKLDGVVRKVLQDAGCRLSG